MDERASPSVMDGPRVQRMNTFYRRSVHRFGPAPSVIIDRPIRSVRRYFLDVLSLRRTSLFLFMDSSNNNIERPVTG